MVIVNIAVSYDSRFTFHASLSYRMSTRRSQTRLRTISLEVVFNPRGFTRLRINQLHIREINKRFFVDNTSAAIRLRVCLLVSLDHADAFDFDLASCRRYFEHAPAPALVATRDNNNLIVLSNFGAFSPCHNCQITSGASETIFIKFLSRSSRATGPNTRVPIGVPSSLINTAAFWSKRIYVPSLRRTSLRVRTITAS